MAQRVQVVLEDDLDGGKADETVTFGLDGTTYEIDLSKKNAAKLRDALAGYVGSARRVSGRRGGGAGRARGRGRSASDSADIRAWAKENGYDVSERGRISAEVRAAYNEAK
ncbi:histone-like nucleoid-structuring protein Lsr2 [Kribbella sp. CA-247076]|uniref:histone-like nucleoid-structuring protein Lsr2 n=1 Tax=Kribbella sp. CA-247076 TaxID=3239941 RepID=UPI003D930EC5